MCCPPVNQYGPRDLDAKLAAEIVRLMTEPTPQDLTDKVIACVTEACPFCEEGRDPRTLGRCPFCEGTMRLRVGEAAEISQRIFEESR